MPRIKLANWHGDLPPGAELDVDDAQLKAMTRDGRVAEVVTPPAAPSATPAAEAAPEPDPESGTSRRRR
jgi:hypothetical protein